MDNELQQKLYRSAMKKIGLRWRRRKSLKGFVAEAQTELRWLRYHYMIEASPQSAAEVERKLSEAAQMLQLAISTEYDRSCFGGMSIRVIHQNICYAEIFIGPQDAWNKIMFLKPAKRHYWPPGRPYTKRRDRSWKDVEKFDFGAFMASVKEEIDRPPEPESYEDDEDEDDEFYF